MEQPAVRRSNESDEINGAQQPPPPVSGLFLNSSSSSSSLNDNARFAVSPIGVVPPATNTPFEDQPDESIIHVPRAGPGTIISTIHESQASHVEAIDFVHKPIEQGREVQCKIIRKKGGRDRFFPQYEMFIENDDNTLTFILSARKKKKSKSSNYVMSTNRLDDEEEDIVAKVRSNFIGTEFCVYDEGKNPIKKVGEERPRQELASVIYEQNILGYNGPRKMTVLLPAMTKQGERIPRIPRNEEESLIANPNDRDVLSLSNKSPQWNEENQSFVLNFNGRVSLASVKNFQIVHENDLDYILLQFGRVTKESFSIDIRYPLSPIQAFGIALSSFDAKLACE